MKVQTTAMRLAAARKLTASLAARYPESAHYCNWRNNVARPFKASSSVNRNAENPSIIYADSFDALGWRMVGEAHKVRRMNHTGWYADNDQSALLRAVVLQIPARDGVPRYVGGAYCTDWDGVTVYLECTSNEPEDCAYQADQYAAREAEESREFYAKDAAEQHIEEARQSIHAINKAALALVREIKAASAKFSPAICAALRDRLNMFMAERAEQFKIIEERQANYWSAVEGN